MDPRPPLVSVIVPTHNRPHLLEAAVDSVVRQDWDEWELIVVDDGSSPPVELAADDSRIRIERLDARRGPAAARNAGLAAATGKWVCFLDDDDLMPPWRIKAALEALLANPQASCHVGTLVRGPAWQLGEIPRRAEAPERDGLLIGTPSVLMLCLERDRVLPFDETLRVSEDVEWWLRQGPAVSPVITDDVVAAVRLHSASRAGLSSEVRFRARLATWEKHRRSLGRFGRRSARIQRRTAESALAAGHRWVAIRHALGAVVAHRNRRHVGLVWRAITGVPTDRDHA